MRPLIQRRLAACVAAALIAVPCPDRGQSIEFVRDDNGRVNWIRVAVRTP